jgi:hypothetical protein
VKDTVADDPRTHGAMLVPVIAGSDKTTISVATGHQEYHPVYMSPGNFTNTARRGPGNSVLPVAFLPIPKSKRQYSNFQSLIDCSLNYSKQTPGKASGVSAICSPDISHVFSTSFRIPTGSDDRAGGCSLSGRTLSIS